MDIKLGKSLISVLPSGECCVLCNAPNGYEWSFKDVFLAAYKKLYKNREEKPSKSETYNYVKELVDIDITEDNILCEDCIQQIFDQIIELLEEFDI